MKKGEVIEINSKPYGFGLYGFVKDELIMLADKGLATEQEVMSVRIGFVCGNCKRHVIRNVADIHLFLSQACGEKCSKALDRIR